MGAVGVDKVLKVNMIEKSRSRVDTYRGASWSTNQLAIFGESRGCISVHLMTMSGVWRPNAAWMEFRVPILLMRMALLN